MPLNLTEIQSLIAALGVKIPDDILAARVRAEEFKTRREKVAADAGGKPADWRLKANFDEVLKRAAEAADGKQFDPAFKLLDEAGQLLLQPDAPPPPTIATPPPTTAPPQAVAEGIATASDQEFQKAWSAAQAAWKTALETVDAQLGRLQQTLRSTDDEELRDIAEFGLNGVTGNFKVPLLAAMQDIEAARDDARRSPARRAAAIATGFLKHLENATEVAACDENPFGVQVSIRKTLGGALTQLNEALKMAQPTEAS